MAVAKPQPPPQTSFHDPINGGGFTSVGDCNGVLCGKAPGKYPHMKTNLSLSSSIFTSPPPPSPFMALRRERKKR